MTTTSTSTSTSTPLWPHNPNGETHPDNIAWGSDDVENLNINWSKIDFLVATKRDDGTVVVHRHPKVPQIGGLGAIIAYQSNLVRFMQDKVGGGDEFIKEAEKHGVLFNIAHMLTNGGELPLN